MGLEYRKGKLYFYRKVRKGNKVVSEYRGSGELATSIAVLEKYDKASKEAKEESKRQEETLHRQADAELLELELSLKDLFTQVALANGYHQHKREWRKKKQP